MVKMSKQLFLRLKQLEVLDLRPSYSGRGMFGSLCISFGSLSSFYSSLHELYKNGEFTDEIDEFFDECIEFRQDSMGLGYVFYSPQLTLDGQFTEEEEEEFDD